MAYKKLWWAKIAFVAVLGTILSLSTHVYLLEYAQRLNPIILGDAVSAQAPSYSPTIVFFAYTSALTPTIFLIFVYWYTEHLFSFKSRFLRTIVLTLLLLGLKGELFRHPFMNFICNLGLGPMKAFLFSLVNQIHVWVANLVLCATVIYFWPPEMKFEKLQK